MMDSIDWFEKAFQSRRIEIYRQGVLERLLPAFDKMEEEAEQKAQEHLDMLKSQPSGWSETPSDQVDEANDVAVDFLSDMVWLRQQTLNNATAGLYHLWEKVLKELLSVAVRYAIMSNSSIPEENRLAEIEDEMKKIKKVSFHKLKNILVDHGFAFPSKPYYRIMNELRLAAHSVKHGPGESLDDLYSLRPDLFQPTPMMELKGVDIENLVISETDFSQFADTVIEFWKDFDITY